MANEVAAKRVFHVERHEVKAASDWKDRAAGWAHHYYTGKCDKCGRGNARVEVFGTSEDARSWIGGGHACDRCEEC